jgi:catechol 2,3-dioxygenase-like lactoylglutathione lyase family enzyme
MIDHISLSVTDLARSRQFNLRALQPLGFTLLMEIPASVTGSDAVLGFGAAPKPEFWLHGAGATAQSVHIAFRAASRKVIDEFHSAALAAGGRDNGAPGPRPATTSKPSATIRREVSRQPAALSCALTSSARAAARFAAGRCMLRAT